MSEATAVKKQTSADLQVKFSKLLWALFSIGQIGHLVKAHMMETARKGCAVLSIFRVGGIHF